MGLYSLPGYDTWLTTDPSDDGSTEAIEAIADRLALDAEAVADAIQSIDPPEPLMVAAFLSGNWDQVRAFYHEAITDQIHRQAVDKYDADCELARRREYAA